MLCIEKEGVLATPKFIEPSENKDYSFSGSSKFSIFRGYCQHYTRVKNIPGYNNWVQLQSNKHNFLVNNYSITPCITYFDASYLPNHYRKKGNEMTSPIERFPCTCTIWIIPNLNLCTMILNTSIAFYRIYYVIQNFFSMKLFDPSGNLIALTHCSKRTCKYKELVIISNKWMCSCSECLK